MWSKSQNLEYGHKLSVPLRRVGFLYCSPAPGDTHPHALSSALPAMTDVFYLGLNTFSSVAVLASD